MAIKIDSKIVAYEIAKDEDADDKAAELALKAAVREDSKVIHMAGPPKRRPNIVYVLADQWRAKSTGYEGNPDVKTPNLDRLAGQSLNFRNTVSVTPVCTPHRAALHQYYALCTTLDDCVGELEKMLGEAGIAENTIFIFTSDHGGMLFSHGIPANWKQVAWDESARVPFLLRYPAVHGRAGRTVETPITTPDILPTLLGLAGIPVPPVIEGEDLSDLVLRGGERDRAALYMSATPFRRGVESSRAIRTSRHTLIRNLDGSVQLFDDSKDLYQMDNLAGRPEHGGLLRELEQRLVAELERTGDRFLPPEEILAQWGLDVPAGVSIPLDAESAGAVYTPTRQG